MAKKTSDTKTNSSVKTTKKTTAKKATGDIVENNEIVIEDNDVIVENTETEVASEQEAEKPVSDVPETESETEDVTTAEESAEKETVHDDADIAEKEKTEQIPVIRAEQIKDIDFDEFHKKDDEIIVPPFQPEHNTESKKISPKPLFPPSKYMKKTVVKRYR